jgi:hypothetical protein
MFAPSSARAPVIALPRLHEGQWHAFWAFQARRFKALRCGRRFGKTEFAKAWIGQGAGARGSLRVVCPAAHDFP